MDWYGLGRLLVGWLSCAAKAMPDRTRAAAIVPPVIHLFRAFAITPSRFLVWSGSRFTPRVENPPLLGNRCFSTSIAPPVHRRLMERDCAADAIIASRNEAHADAQTGRRPLC